MSAEKQVRTIIAEKLGMLEEKITPSSILVDDLGADSLDAVEILMALEDEFDIEIPDEDAEKIKTVKDATLYVQSKV